MHSRATGTKLVVRQALEEPVVSEVWAPNIDRKKFGPKFRQDAKPLEEVISKMSQMELESCKNILDGEGKVEINVNGKECIVDTELMQIERVTKKETGMSSESRTNLVYEYTPNVVEPSFGIGRILYSLIEHSYWPRPEDKQRGVNLSPSHLTPGFVLPSPHRPNKMSSRSPLWPRRLCSHNPLPRYPCILRY